MNQRSIAPIPLITAIVLCLAALTELTSLARGLTLGLTFLSSFSHLVTFAAYVFFAVVLFLNRRDMLLYLAPAGLALAAAISLATQLRSANIKTQLYTEQKKFKAKMNYADKLSVPYVVFLGEDEIRDGIVACKDMESGEQTEVTLADFTLPG